MTALVVFVDLHNISLLLYKSKDAYWFKSIPYVYSKSLFSASFSEDEFYLEILSTFTAEQNIKLDTCDVLLTGYLEAPRLGIAPDSLFSKSIKSVHTTSLYEVVKAVESYYPIVVNNHSLLTKESCFAQAPVQYSFMPANVLDNDELNYYANLELYPQIVTNEIAIQIDLDSNIVRLLPPQFALNPDVPLVFCGSRFSHAYKFPELDYLLMLSFLKKPGVYDIRRDSSNALILTTLLKSRFPDVVIDVEIPHAETVIVSNNVIECSIQTQEGTAQLVHIDKNRLLVIPAAKGERVNLKLKSRDLTVREKTVVGSNIGLIFDTRENKHVSVTDIKNFSVGIKNFKSVALDKTK